MNLPATTDPSGQPLDPSSIRAPNAGMKKAVNRTARLFEILDKAGNTKPVGNLNRADLYRHECEATLDKVSKPTVAFRQTQTNEL